MTWKGECPTRTHSTGLVLTFVQSFTTLDLEWRTQVYSSLRTERGSDLDRCMVIGSTKRMNGLNEYTLLCRSRVETESCNGMIVVEI